LKKIILFIENNLNYLNVQSQIFELEDYHVLKASTLEKAEAELKEKRIHVAIFDIRMIDDDDPEDISGLLMAKKEEYKILPKIMLTGYPDLEYVREALRTNKNEYRPAVDFLSKDEGPQALIQSVEKTFDKYVLIDWDLIIHQNQSENSSFRDLVKSVIPKQGTPFLDERTDEAEDIFRKLFYKKNEITIDQVLWRRPNDNRVCVSVLINNSNGKLTYSKVVLGLNNAATQQGISDYKTSGNVLEIKINETMHFVAMAYPSSADI